MTITLVYVSSLNGKITKGSDPNVPNWSSAEDKKHFASFLKQFEVIIAGRKTYEASIKTGPAKKKQHRMVLTREPEKYQNKTIPGVLEFTKDSPTKIVNRLKKSGYKKVLLASGGTVTSEFLKAKLVDKIVLTVEPLIFGTGTPMIAENDFEVKLRLEGFKKLNSKGTLLLSYSVID